jgi:uncharacterized protein YxjI
MSLLERNTFFVKEHVGYFKAANAYDVLDPATGGIIGTVRETVPNVFLKLLKFTDYKTMIPFTVDIFDTDGQKLVTLRRGWRLFRSTVNVTDAQGGKLGSYHQRLLSLGGKFEVMNRMDMPVAMFAGDWKGWNFTFRDSREKELAKVTKKWAGLGKELLTSADNYVVDVSPDVRDNDLKRLILAAAFCVDMVLKEGAR